MTNFNNFDLQLLTNNTTSYISQTSGLKTNVPRTGPGSESWNKMTPDQQKAWLKAAEERNSKALKDMEKARANNTNSSINTPISRGFKATPPIAQNPQQQIIVDAAQEMAINNRTLIAKVDFIQARTDSLTRLPRHYAVSMMGLLTSAGSRMVDQTPNAPIQVSFEYIINPQRVDTSNPHRFPTMVSEELSTQRNRVVFYVENEVQGTKWVHVLEDFAKGFKASPTTQQQVVDAAVNFTIKRAYEYIEYIPNTLTPEMVNQVGGFNKVEACALSAGHSDIKDRDSTEFKPILPKAVRNENNYLDSDWLVIDIETYRANTDKNIQKPYLAAWTLVSKGKLGTSEYVYWADKFTSEQGADTIRRWTELLPRGGYVFAHNGGDFDYKVLMASILKLTQLDSTYSFGQATTRNGDTFYQFELKRTVRIVKADGNLKSISTTWIFRDSINLLPSSLLSIGDAFFPNVFPKLKMHHEPTWALFNSGMGDSLHAWDSTTKQITPHFAEYATPLEFLVEYCVRDVYILTLALLKYFVSLKQTNPSLRDKEAVTAAGIGMQTFLTYFYDANKYPIETMGLKSPKWNFLKSSFHGGRTEVFHSGIGFENNLYHFDIPGAYSHILQTELPYGNSLHVSQPTANLNALEYLTTLHESGKIGFFFYSATCPEGLNIPVLCIKMDFKLIWPKGSFQGTATSWELLEAAKSGYSLVLHEGEVYNVGFPYRAYAANFVAIKDAADKAGDQVTRTLAKLFNNSIYGKSASSYYDKASVMSSNSMVDKYNILFQVYNLTEYGDEHTLVNYNVKPLDTDFTQPEYMAKDFKDRAYKAYYKSQQDLDINMAVASAVASKARLLLLSLMREVESRGGVMIYCDTDSVFAILPQNPINLPFGPFIWDENKGNNKLVRMLAMAPKMYWYETSTGKVVFKVKGVSTRNSNYTYENLKALFLAQEFITFKDQQQFRNLKTGLHFEGVKVVTDVMKTYNIYAHSKRTWVFENGTATTTPIALDSKLARSLVQTPELAKDHSIADLIQQVGKSYSLTGGKHIGQSVNQTKHYVTVSEPLANFPDSLRKVLNSLYDVVAQNTNNMKQVTDVRFIQLVLSQVDSNAFKTAAIFPGVSWMELSETTFMSIITREVQRLIDEYEGSFIPDMAHFKVVFGTTVPKAAYQSNMNQLVFNSRIRSMEKADPAKVLKQQQLLAAELERIAKAQATFDKSMESVMDQLQPHVENWLAQVKAALQSSDTSAKVVSLLEKTLSAKRVFRSSAEEALSLPVLNQSQRDAIQASLYPAFTETLIHLMTTKQNVTIHNIHDDIMNRLNTNKSSPSEVQMVMKFVWFFVVNLSAAGFLMVMGIDVKQENLSKFLKFGKVTTFCINPSKFPEVAKYFMIKFMSDKISPVPYIYTDVKTAPYASETKQYTINKLNSVKVMISQEYMTVLRNILETIDKAKADMDTILGFVNATIDTINETSRIAQGGKMAAGTRIRHIVSNRSTLVSRLEAIKSKLPAKSTDKALDQARLLESLYHTIGWYSTSEIKGGHLTLDMAIHNYTKLLTWLQVMGGQDHFYFKHMCDFRGRVYPRWTDFSHQGPKYLRPAFILGDHFKLSLDGLTICLGEERMNPVAAEMVKNTPNFRTMDIKDIFKQASQYVNKVLSGVNNEEADWSYVGRVVEMGKILIGHSIIPAPVQYDMKNNAFQHMAAITGNVQLMEITGIIYNKEAPDMYSYVISEAVKDMKAMVKDLQSFKPNRSLTAETLEKLGLTVAQTEVMDIDEEDNTLSPISGLEQPGEQELLEAPTTSINKGSKQTPKQLIITLNKAIKVIEEDPKRARKALKKAVMTTPYNASFYSLMEYVMRGSTETGLFTGTVWRRKDNIILTKFILGAINRTIGVEMNTMKYINSMAAQHDKATTWSLAPISDFKPVMNNRETKVIEMTVSHLGREVHTTVSVDMNKIDARKNSNALFVNIVHSLDATHLDEIMKAIPQQVLTIHDAYLVPWNIDGEHLKLTAHQTFVNMYQQGTFNNIYTDLFNQTKACLTYEEFTKHLGIKPWPANVGSSTKMMSM